MELDTITNAIGENIGLISKAVITVYDRRGSQVSEEVLGAKGALDAASVPGAKKKDGEHFTQEEINGLRQALEDTLAANSLNAAEKKFIVQFNPSTLSLHARGEGFMPMLSYGENSQPGQDTKSKVRVYLTVQLVFDQVDPLDAFIQDKTNIAVTNVATGAAKTVMTVAGKKKVTVQETVEGFIAMLRSPNTRMVTFSWGQMYYQGVVNNVSAQYTMFNMQGQPIRAHVSLSIMCVDGSSSAAQMGEPWKSAFDSMSAAGGFNGVKEVQEIGNLFNISM
ncbi:MAG: hypothetical protein IJT34_09415 [Butyrivibrio sp.]|nr:hypothetical protein [Butyrivibrio sp.]